MGFSTTDWVAFFIFGASALVRTFGKRLVRIIGLAVKPFAFAGLILSLSHHGSAPGQRPITNNAPSINTNNQSGGTDILNIRLSQARNLEREAKRGGSRNWR